MSDEELTRLLDEKLPRHKAPESLKARLAAEVAPAPRAPRRATRWWLPLASALATAAVVLLALRVVRPNFVQRELLADEAVNDHLRVVAAQHPVEIESGGIHQVKPWFTGKLDFAPPVSFSGDEEFPLRGGSVGYFRDRRAAVFVFARRLHTISLIVVPAEGWAWPARAEKTERGFNVLLWSEGALGFALVSDVNRADLQLLEKKLH